MVSEFSGSCSLLVRCGIFKRRNLGVLGRHFNDFTFRANTYTMQGLGICAAAF